MSDITLNLPGRYATRVRGLVKEEMACDAEGMPATGITQDEFNETFAKVEAHRAILDQLGWEGTGAGKLCAPRDNVKVILEQLLDRISNEIAETVGEYRKDAPIEPSEVERLAEELAWLANAYLTVAPKAVVA